jgi:putative CocE/NonD family hydrolase
MRDGVQLHTTIYAPLDTTRAWPILMHRTPYSCRPYGPDASTYVNRPWTAYLRADGYIFVCQDVRGRWMSEGDYDNMRPHVRGETPIDESSDTYDTIEWLLANVPRNSGKVGIWGISYPGFYAAAALPEAHPALVAASPQAPIADFYFDDFHHRGAYTLAYFRIQPVFGFQTEPTGEDWYRIIDPGTRDGYAFYLGLGPLSNAAERYPQYAQDFFWNQIVEHPNYDAFWQARSILPHLVGVHTATMTVGGWFDAEDLYGPLNIYRTLERENPSLANVLVMGPWGHGDWARRSATQVSGDLAFGDSLSDFYLREVEAPFFRHYLHGAGEGPDFEALVFDTGRREWHRFGAWPPAGVEPFRLYLRDGERLATDPPAAGEDEHTEYVSDPNEPVPDSDRIRIVITPRAYMTEDQRFAERRPDVIEFTTPVLEEDVTLAGDLVAHLEASTTGTDADWVVKLIDVFPDSTRDQEGVTPPNQHLSGYQMMVRSEIQRGRFRNSFEKPEPFVPGEVATVEFPLQDVFHTFRAGHRIMVQVQSTWFPLFDRNPQTFVPNIYRATEKDFVNAAHRVWHAPGRASWIEVKVLSQAGAP